MKKLLALLVVLLLATGAFAQDINISAGAEIDYNYMLIGFGTDPNDNTIVFNALSIGAYVDITYVSIGVSYIFSIGDPTGAVYVDGTKDEVNSDLFTAIMEKTSISYLAITALGKYPFDVGGVTIFPMLGLEYILNLSMEQDGTDMKDTMTDEQKDSLNDLFILGGVGADFNITESIYARVLALFAFNLTPDSPLGIMGGAENEWGWTVKAGVAIGYRF
jgi:hypothetical protein